MTRDRQMGRGPSGRGVPPRDGRAPQRQPHRPEQDRHGRTRGGSSRQTRSSASGAPDGLLSVDTSREGITRYQFLGLAGAVGLALTAGHLIDYQIVNGGEYRRRANERRLLEQRLYAKRGTIYDRNGNVLTSSVECSNVYVNPKLIDRSQRKKAIRALVDVLDMDRETVTDMVDADSTFVYVKRQVDDEDVERLRGEGIAGIEFEPAIKRVYPYGSLASQVLGVVNVDNVGTTGLEQYYDEILTGTDGWIKRERGADGSFVAGGAYEKSPAQDGMDIMLGLDVTIQRAAEEAIAKAVESSGAKCGSVIVTDPGTGEILAACSYPTYDPTDLVNTAYEDMNLRVVTDVYEPGSVFKTFVSAAAIDLDLMSPTTTFDVPAVVKAGDDDVRDVDGRSVAETMSLREILRRSSNTGMVLVGERVGADRFDKRVIKGFGFGSSTGIDFPGESLGIIKKRSEYDGASLASMSFGQALAVEPVQMVRAMSAIANKGVMTTPHFVTERAGQKLDWTDGEQRAIGEEAAAQVADMMLTVVDEGTGQGARVQGFEISGKTGTAERAVEGVAGYQEGNHMASFMGFVSTDDPRVLCYVTLDGTSALSYAATPVFKEIMEEALPTLGIKPTR